MGVFVGKMRGRVLERVRRLQFRLIGGQLYEIVHFI